MIKKLIREIHSNESGQGFIEYGLIIVLIVLALVASTRSLATDGIAPKYGEITTELQNVQVQ